MRLPVKCTLPLLPSEVRLPDPKGSVSPLVSPIEKRYSYNMTKETVMLCMNALKAFTEGYLEEAEGFMPGFAEAFFAQEPSEREAIMDLFLAELSA